MEMDPGELGQDGECIMEGTSDDHLLSQGSPDMNEIFGDPQVLCRVGDLYQVEIPPLLTEREHLQLMKNPSDAEVTIDQSFLVGLPIPVMWVCQQVDNIKHEVLEFDGDPGTTLNINVMVESERSKKIPINLNCEESKVKDEYLDFTSDNRKGSGESENGEQATVMDLPLRRHKEPRLDKTHSNKGFSPLPGSIGSSWSNMEVESFLLGLYIFGKNLVLVKIFVETKEMGDILSYYYGKFYRSDGYRRWSECRKVRSRKCIHGQRIFTGWRQQELLSRLLSHASKECHNTLLEVSKSFGEGKTSLEDYVSALKVAVGMNALIEAIGIGKGKHDLTGMVDPIKTTRPEIPIGKECNSLSAGDIIKFLTGDFRLSKNKSHDLFWEAVWPRLLATGWHSEEPKNQNYAGSKNSLVFLIPGVKKFSRRRLVKGNHYFDSVADVLNKVASDPRLLEIEGESPKNGGNKEENGWDTKPKFDKDGPSGSRRQSYLQPKIPNCEPDIEKFTVVDTSLEHGEGPLKIRELRTLPVDTIISPPTSLSREIDTESSEEQDDEPESAALLSNGLGDSNIRRPIDNFFERGVCTDISDCLLSGSKHRRGINSVDITRVAMEDQENHFASTSGDKHLRKTLKRQNSQGIKSCRSNYLTPITKRRRLTACEHEETSRRANVLSLGSRANVLSLGSRANVLSLGSRAHLNSSGGSGNTGCLPQEKVSNGSSAKGNSGDSSEGILSEDNVVAAVSHEKVERRPLIDLNLPHGLEELETAEPITTEVADSQDDPTRKLSSFLVETNKQEVSQTLETSNDMVNVEQQPEGRRHSTRNRPLTTKALEALACGYLNTKRKWRGEKDMFQEDAISRPSRRARGRGRVKGKPNGVAYGLVDYKADEGVDEECSSNTNFISNSQVWSEREDSHELLEAVSPACYPELSANKDD